MAREDYLGEFEQMVMWTVLRLGQGAYGARVIDELAERVGRKVSSGALYATLDRLEAKGMLSSRLDDADRARGGRRRRYLSVSAEGQRALSQSRARWTELWEGLEPEAGAS